MSAYAGNVPGGHIERFFDLSMDLLAIACPRTDRWVRVNASFRRILGWTADELLARPLLEIVHPDDQQCSRNALAVLESGKSLIAFQNRIRCQDGSHRWIEWQCTPYPDEDLVYCAGREVDERNRIELALQDSERRFRDTFENAGVGIAHVALDGRWLRVNSRLCAITGYTEEELCARTFGDITHPDDLEADWAEARRLVAGEILNYSLEKRYRTKDGSLVWVNLTVSLQRDDTGSPLNFISVVEDITARKQAEAERENLLIELRNTERRLALALEAAEAGTFDIELTPGVRPLVSDGARRLFGFGVDDQPTFEDFVERVHPDDRPRVVETISHSVDSGRGHFIEYRIVRPVGDEVWVASRAEVLAANGSQPSRLIGALIDVTSRKRIEEALATERDRLASIFAQAPAFLSVLRGPEHVFEFANVAYLQMVGHRDIVGQPLLTALPELAGQGFDRILDQVLASGEPFLGTGVPVRLQRTPDAEQEQIYCDFVYAPLIEPDGARSGVVAIGYDVTRRVRAEQAERALRDQLTANAAESRQIADSLPQLVWVTRPDGHHEWYNRRWYEYTGASFEQSCGEQWAHFFHPDDIAESQRRWMHSLETGEPYEVEYRCRRYDGAWRWFLGRAEPIRNESGAIVRWFGTCTDIHDQKQTEEALRSSNQDLERFAYVASHDLQEPLRIVTSYSQLAERHLGSHVDERAAQFFGFVHDAAQRMSRLIQDLLIYARSSGSDALQLKLTDMNVVLALALANLRSRIDETGATLTWDHLPSVPGVEGLLVQVFQNLIGNAIKYTRSGIAPQVHIGAQNEGGQWIFCVRDNGQGIGPEHLHKVFELFSRLHGRDVSGSGIGLATVKRIIERHGGRVWAESEVGTGSTFYFSMPDP